MGQEAGFTAGREPATSSHPRNGGQCAGRSPRTSGHIRARGTYDNSQFDWNSYWSNNKFNEAYVTGVKPAKDVRSYEYDGFYGTYENVRRIGVLAEGEAAIAETGDKTIYKHN